MATGGHDSGDVSPLDEMCDDLPTLYERLFPARAKWRNIGLKLKVEPDTLEAIASKHNNPDDCLREMLTKRLQAVGSLSWREVCNCLRSRTVDRNDVAEKIEEWRKDIVNTTSKIQVPPLLSLPVTGGLNDCLVKQTNQVTSAMTTVGEISLTEDNSREEKCCDLQEKIDCLESQFSYLTRDAGERLKQEHVPIEEFYRKVSSMTLSLKIVAGKYFKETFESVSSFDVLWGHLNQFWDFFNCELFQHVVRVMFTEADDPLLSKLAEYESELKEFLSKTKLSDFVDHWPFSITKPPKTVIRKLKGVLISVHKKWEDCTLYDIKKTRQKFSEEFMLPPEFMVLVGAGNGSVSILLYVPHSLASSIEEQVKQGKEDILADNGFLSITIDGVQVYPLPSMEQASLHGLTMETLKRKTKITEEQLETREEETDLSKLSSIDNTDEDPPRPPPVEEGYLEEEKGGLEASSKLADEVADDQTLNILHPLTFLEWEEWPSLPVEMSNACSVHLNGTLYVGGGSTTGLRADAALYSFKPGVDSTWTVTDTPTYWYTLAVHDSELLLVGGCDHSTRKQTNKVFTMRDGQFVEILPPMNERRYLPSTASNESALVVAGGWVTSGNVSSVEVFKDSQWTTAPSLPITRSRMKSALHGDQWYLIMDQGKVFYVSLQSLISGGDQSPWETLPVTPIHYSAAAFFGGYLLSIAGGNLTTTIHAFSFSTQSWEHVADLPLSPGMPTAVVLSREQLIVSSGARVLQGKLSVTPFDTDSHFTMRAIDRLKASAGIFLIEKLVQNTSPTAFPAVAGVDVQDVYNHILEEWASVRGLHPPTWAELFRVLKEMGLSELAGRMEKHLRGSVPENPPRPPPDDSEEEKDDETPEQEILRLNNVLAEYISANSLLKKQLKKANINPEHHLKSEKVKEEQLNPASIKEEPTFDKDNQSPSFSLKHIKQETKADPQTTDEQASIHYNHLSGLAVTGEDVYTASLYYLGSELHSREIYFVVNCDNGIHNTFVSEEYSSKKAVLGVNQPIDFEEDSLTLDIPMAGAKVKGGWKITPMFHPTVIKKHVDQFKPGQRIPHCHLKAEMTSKRKKTAPKLFYQVKLVGAKDPYNIITIDLDPQQTLPETTFSDLVTFKPAVSSQGNEARELLMQPQSHVTRYPPSLGPRHYPVASHSRNMSELPPSLLSVEQSRTSLTLSSATPPLPPHWNTQLPQWSHTGPFQPAITSQPIATIDELVTHVGIDKDLLNQPCSTEHLAKIAHLVPNWQKYAIALGVNEPHILSISSNSLLDPEMKAQQVLSLWKQTNGFKATYSVLVDVCLQKKDVQLAECICNIVKEDLPRPHPITGEKREATKHTEQGPSDKRPRLNTASEDTLKLD